MKFKPKFKHENVDIMRGRPKFRATVSACSGAFKFKVVKRREIEPF